MPLPFFFIAEKKRCCCYAAKKIEKGMGKREKAIRRSVLPLLGLLPAQKEH